jgi:hypothetical protein
MPGLFYRANEEWIIHDAAAMEAAETEESE